MKKIKIYILDILCLLLALCCIAACTPTGSESSSPPISEGTASSGFSSSGSSSAASGDKSSGSSDSFESSASSSDHSEDGSSEVSHGASSEEESSSGGTGNNSSQTSSPDASSQTSSSHSSAPSQTSSQTSSATSSAPPAVSSQPPESVPTSNTSSKTPDPIVTTPSPIQYLEPVASGKITYENNNTTIDASNTTDGYVMVKYSEATSSTIKVLVETPKGNTYQYILASDNKYDVLPLSEGNGKYKINIYMNISGTSYAYVYGAEVNATVNEFSPYLRPNQYVDYTKSTKPVTHATTLINTSHTELEKVEIIYNYVINNYSYDYDKAATVKSGYLPVIDSVYAAKKGICFDYAALITSMLRTQGVPTKLEIGYAGSAYHAWISVYTKDAGWVNGVIRFDGKKWKMMDPTFAAGSNPPQSFLANESEYKVTYTY